MCQDNDRLTQDSSNVFGGDTDTDVSPASGLKKRNYGVQHRQTATNKFRRELLNMKAKKIKLLENNKEKEDEDLLFLKSVLPDLKILSQTQKMRTKIQFQEILLQETLNLLQSTTNQTTVVGSYNPYTAEWHTNNEGTQNVETNYCL